MEITKFIDLPGIADLEERLERFDKLYADEAQQLSRDLDHKSIELFGITVEDTLRRPIKDGEPYDEAAIALDREWDSYFAWIEGDWSPAEDAFWEAVAIDMSKNDDEYLECMEAFTRQIVCVARDLHPAASFRWRKDMPKTDRQIEAEAEAWGRFLKDD